MKVLITFFPIDDMGGIINHHEQLCAGLRELGHEVTTKLLMYRDSAPKSVAGGRGSMDHSGLEFDQRRGFSWTGKDIIAYKGKANLEKWKTYAKQFDLIIWQVAVPTKRKENLGNMDWPHLYNVDVKQIAMIHDGNFLASYPWLHIVGNFLTGLACVHTCAYNSAAHIDVPSRLVLNPFAITYPNLSREAFEARDGFLSVQTWKAWKRVPDLLRAIPYMGNYTKRVAGKGIDYYYLTSKDKCKYPGVWDDAITHGMQYLDVITNEERDMILRESKCLVDASWSLKYAKIGAHFNRVYVEALMNGAVPIVKDLAVGLGEHELFRSGVNCVTVPHDASPAQFAMAVNSVCKMPYDEYVEFMNKALPTLIHFDRTEVAQRLLDLADGLYGQYGKLSEEVKLDGYKAVVEFFGVKQ